MKRKYSQEEVWEYIENSQIKLFYFNKNDSNIFVRKRFGLAWTFNLANVWSWVIIGLSLATLAITINVLN